MGEKILFQKNVFNKLEYEKTIDTTFSQLRDPVQAQISEQISVSEFFQLYNNLFYEIPEEGNTNSHEFLIKTSADYIGYENDSDEIQALQDEIANLRTEILELQQAEIDESVGLENEDSSLANTTTNSSVTSTTTSTSTGGSGGGGY
tara:strand:+ start:380 stop:820 length:441 start_codon:yes stop_codon:yes gene_type:complete